ncbi:Ornithine carbamoyltransferase [Candidatus Magnetomorum sp. HK-1]|nr:Ornithine carbamoyltransferase [Candidatus Magnetomorum sp. HK-1]
MKKDILHLWDLTKNDCNQLIERSLVLKRDRASLMSYRPLIGKSMGLLFEKASTRTRISFETAMNQLGGATIYLNPKDTQISRNEPIKDTARVLSGYLDIIVVRTYSQKIIEEMAEWASIPVINALTDSYHPCQILSDVMTVVEKFGRYDGLKIAWIGDGNNVAHSWINISAILGIDLTLACPENYMPDPEIIKRAKEDGCGTIKLTTDPVQAVTDADVVNTDVWASMGQESQSEDRKKIFQPFQVNAKLMSMAKKHAAIMHCLPAHRDEEITEEVLESANSLIWQQAQNKMFMHKAVLEGLLTQSD